MKLFFLPIVLILLSFNANIDGPTTNDIYKFSRDIEAKMKKDTTFQWKDQLAAIEYSLNGNYKKALHTWDKSMPKTPVVTAEDISNFKQFKAQDAKEYILNRSKSEKVIIINEAYHNSRHRVFTTSLLKGLYKNGYRYFGVEALSDPYINQRQFPILSSGNTYIQESQYANLVKEALDIGFIVFGYDEGNYQKKGKEIQIMQAKNIAKIIAENPKDKFLIHCGYDHINEATPGIKEWEKAMAGRLYEITAINPFTIDQLPCSEKGDLRFNSPYIPMANSKKPVIMVNANGNTFNSVINDIRADCRIIFPLTTYINGRPDWLSMDGRRKTFRVPTNTITEFPVMVMAYRKNEMWQGGIPADIVEIANKDEVADLILDKGKYQIIVKDKDYKVIQNYEKKIQQ